MNETYLDTISIILIALYLNRPNHLAKCDPKKWIEVVSILRKYRPTMQQAPETFIKNGLWCEALALQSSLSLDWAITIRHQGRAITAADIAYPRLWLRRLGANAPAALWASNPFSAQDIIGVAGTRSPDGEDIRRIRHLGSAIGNSGSTVISGNGFGCDALVQGAAHNVNGKVVSLLPHGITLAEPLSERHCMMSVAHPSEPFSRTLAMQRNLLLYAASQFTVAVSPRFRQGGTWFGAVDALRRRICPVYLLADEGDPACKALVSLGAKLLKDLDQLPDGDEGLTQSRNLFSWVG